MRRARERRLAPMGSSRYTSFSLVTDAAIGICGGIEIGKAGANAARASHHARHAEADVVGALIADDLQWHARHHGALDGRCAVFFQQLPRQRRQEAAHRRTEADTCDIDVDAGALDDSCSTVLNAASSWIVECLGDHDLRERFGGAIFRQLRAGQAPIELGANSLKCFQPFA